MNDNHIDWVGQGGQNANQAAAAARFAAYVAACEQSIERQDAELTQQAPGLTFQEVSRRQAAIEGRRDQLAAAVSAIAQAHDAAQRLNPIDFWEVRRHVEADEASLRRRRTLEAQAGRLAADFEALRTEVEAASGPEAAPVRALAAQVERARRLADRAVERTLDVRATVAERCRSNEDYLMVALELALPETGVIAMLVTVADAEDEAVAADSDEDEDEEEEEEEEEV